MSVVLLLWSASAGADRHGERNGWEATLDRVAPAVLVMRVSSVRSFDATQPGYQTATGFVVDAERGLILTNRHVVMPGPVTAEAVFLNNEEVDIQAVYRDPVHDFGFYRFDPGAVQFIDHGQLELAPERAKVGTEIRVIGNDAGEKLSILAGTIARLDRPAPHYGSNTFNDFNTFYIQAASGTSGGSSGSPVIDRSGKVVAINAGGKRFAASSFYLPLDRVRRALELIQRGEPVTRGTMQTVLRHLPYDELRRLGLREETETMMRQTFTEGTGMIVVAEIVPDGPADGLLEIGDIIVRVDGEPVNAFIPIEARLDELVGAHVMLDVERGGRQVRVEVPVGDLHSITPSAYLEVGGAVLNTLSYQQARNHAVPVGGVFVASSGYMISRAGIPAGAVITSVADQPTPTLEEFERVMTGLADGEQVPVRYWVLGSSRNPTVAVMRVDRQWFGMRHCRWEERSGSWPCEASPEPPPRVAPKPASTSFTSRNGKPLKKLLPSMVMVEYDIPYRLDGVHGDRFQGSGLVVDAERGLVVVDRETVPIALGDLSLTFSSSVQVPGEVVYLHPEHNIAVIRYDPELLGDTPIRSAQLHERELHPGDEVWLVTMTVGERVLARRTEIARREPLSLPPTYPPRFLERNLEVVTVANTPSSVGGVLADKKGRVLALWSAFSTDSGKEMDSFFAGIPIRTIREITEPLSAGREVGWRTLGIELVPLTLAEARHRGLSDEQARELERSDPRERHVLQIYRLTSGSPAASLLRQGDLLLRIDGQTVTRVHDVERASMKDEVRLQVLRDGEVLDLVVPTEPLDGRGTTRAILWSGALLQGPPRMLSSQLGLPRSGVYVSRYWYGSPANRYGVQATLRILEVDGQPTPDLDAFLEIVRNKPHRGAVRLRMVDLRGRVELRTLKLDLVYWPTYELVREAGGWQRRPLAPVGESAGQAIEQ